MKEYNKIHSKIRIPRKQNSGIIVPHVVQKEETPETKTVPDNGKRFTVKVAQWVMEKFKDQDTPTRKVIDLGTDLTWQNAKKMAKENKGSWII